MDAFIPTDPPPSGLGPNGWYIGAARAAFDRLYSRATVLAFHAARARRLDYDDASDVAARACEGLVEAFRAGTLDPDKPEALKAWVEARVFYRWKDLREARRRAEERTERIEEGKADYVDPATITTDPDLGRLELRDAVVRAVREMTPHQRSVAVLMRAGSTPQEIADELGIANQSARAAVCRTAKLLREALGPQFAKVMARRQDWYGAKRKQRPRETME